MKDGKYTTLRGSKSRYSNFSYLYVASIVSLVFISTVVLKSTASFLFPNYFIYIFGALLVFYFVSKIEFEIVSVFSVHLYVISIILLILPLLIGQITRGAVRWIPLGPVAIQPSEIVRPFLILFIAKYLTNSKLTFERLIKASLLVFLPLFLILIQPSLGVTLMTFVGFVGVILATSINKKTIVMSFLVFLVFVPVFWQFLADYQRERIVSFTNPQLDPYGSGYNSIQSVISVGSGGIFGRGLGQGYQTQLSFLPERHNDFIFASIAEELGMVGVGITLICLFVIMWKLIQFLENALNPVARAYISGVLLYFFVQTIFNAGMNMGLFPVSGIPLPLVSSGGSSLLATVVTLSLAQKAKKE